MVSGRKRGVVATRRAIDFERGRPVHTDFLSERRGFWPEARTVRKKNLETTRTIDL